MFAVLANEVDLIGDHIEQSWLCSIGDLLTNSKKRKIKVNYSWLLTSCQYPTMKCIHQSDMSSVLLTWKTLALFEDTNVMNCLLKEGYWPLFASPLTSCTYLKSYWGFIGTFRECKGRSHQFFFMQFLALCLENTRRTTDVEFSQEESAL